MYFPIVPLNAELPEEFLPHLEALQSLAASIVTEGHLPGPDQIDADLLAAITLVSGPYRVLEPNVESWLISQIWEAGGPLLNLESDCRCRCESPGTPAYFLTERAAFKKDSGEIMGGHMFLDHDYEVISQRPEELASFVQRYTLTSEGFVPRK